LPASGPPRSATASARYAVERAGAWRFRRVVLHSWASVRSFSSDAPASLRGVLFTRRPPARVRLRAAPAQPHDGGVRRREAPQHVVELHARHGLAAAQAMTASAGRHSGAPVLITLHRSQPTIPEQETAYLSMEPRRACALLAPPACDIVWHTPPVTRSKQTCYILSVIGTTHDTETFRGLRLFFH